MSIVLKEHKWTESVIQSRKLGKKPSETLRRVARYYMDRGYNKRETREILDSFLLQCEPTSSLPKWSNTLDYAVARAVKYKAVNVDTISITAPEMARIDTLEGVQIKRLAFTFLCLAKYWKIVLPQGNYWVNNKDSEIMSMANINTSIKRQCAMYSALREADMIQFSHRVDNTNVRVSFVEDGEIIMHISDFRNLGCQYLRYHGGAYIECQSCGIVTKISDPVKGKKQKYCKVCASKVAIQQNISSVERSRSRASAKSNASKKMYTIYMHKSPNKKRYIGTTGTSLAHRWKNGVGYIDNQSFYSDILKFGWDSIEHYKIAEVPSKEEAKVIESIYIRKYKTNIKNHGYNRFSNSITYEFDDNLTDNYFMKQVDGSGKDLVLEFHRGCK